jgi:PAS domain S-box-containing protein
MGSTPVGISNGAELTGLNDVLITDQLALRPSHAADYDAERRVLLELTRAIAHHPQDVLQRLADLALEAAHADSAGISILHPGHEQFRWDAVSGELKHHLGQTIPRLACPCTAAIARSGAILLHDPERYFHILRAIKPRVHEALLVPWGVRGKLIGTVWVAHHTPGKRFDAEDSRYLGVLSDLAACAYQATSAIETAQSGKGELEQQVEERTRSLTQGNAALQNEVAERKKVEAALRDSEARLSAIFDSLPVGVGVFQNDGSLVRANPEMYRYLPTGHMPSTDPARGWRWSAEDADGRAVDPRDFPGARAYRGERVVPGIEMRYVQDDGTQLWTQFASVPVRDSKGTVTGQVGVITDITELKRISLAVVESEFLFRALAEQAPAFIWRIDTHGNATYLNRRFRQVTGLDPGQFMGPGWHAMLHPDEATAYLATVNHALQTRVPFKARVRIKVRNDGWRWYEVHGAPLFTVNGEYAGHVGLGMDIDAAVHSEEVLREADRRKDVFLATLAHELRNPLAPITNGLHMLRYPEGRRGADRIVEIVQRQVSQLVRLVDDLMEVSRITRGKLDLKCEPTELKDILDSALEISEPLVRRGRHELTLSLPPQPLWLNADMLRLTQVFANLLNNAAKYTDPGGHIGVSARKEGNQVAVSVHDDGVGISEEQLPRVFDMFLQVRQTSGPHRGGLGIGLTMVRNLVAMHGGSVEARSAGVGRGSEFIVRLPLMEHSASSPAQAQPSTLGCLAGRRILVVDDNRDAADTLEMMLSAAGAQVNTVYDGPAALATLPELKPQIAILDIGMPGMDGYELARHIRDIEQFKDIKIFALSGWGQEADRARSAQSGFDDHLTKPVDLQRLDKLLGGY